MTKHTRVLVTGNVKWAVAAAITCARRLRYLAIAALAVRIAAAATTWPASQVRPTIAVAQLMANAHRPRITAIFQIPFVILNWAPAKAAVAMSSVNLERVPENRCSVLSRKGIGS